MASLYKRGKLWYVKYSLKGKTVRKSISKDKKTALEYKAQLETQISRRRLSLPVYNYSWADFVKKYLDYSKTNKRQRTWDLDTTALKSFADFARPKTMGDISKERLEEWKSHRLKDISPTSVNIHLRQIKAGFRKAVEWGLIEERQFSGVNQIKIMKKLPRFLSLDELKKLKEATPSRWWTMFYTMICTGLRLGEFTHLKWSHMDFERNVIRIQADREWAPKDFEMREIPLYSDLAKMLKKMKKQNGDGAYIFHNGNANGTLTRRIQRKFEGYYKKAKIEKCRIHDLRHTFASHLVMEGVDLLSVRDLLGHSSVKTTEIYAHLSPSYRQKAIEKLKFGAQFSAQ